MDAQNLDAFLYFRFSPAFRHWRRINEETLNFNKTVRLEAVGKLYRGVARGSIRKRYRFAFLVRLKITTESDFTVWKLAKVQVINQFEHFAFVAFEDEDVVEIRHKPAASGSPCCRTGAG